MKYYVDRKKYKIKPFILVIFSIILLFNLFFYFYDKKIFPSVLEKSKSLIQAKTIETISETGTELFNDEFKYDEMIIIEKDSEGNINLIRANTVKLNYLASQIAIKCNENLKKVGDVGVEVPVGWFTNNSAVYNLGPNINVKMEPVGSISVSYESKFESAGINQTRHKIYLNVDAVVRIITPLHNEELNVSCEIPVSETIIVGRIPQTAIDFAQNSKNDN